MKSIFCILLVLCFSPGLSKGQIRTDDTALVLEKLFGRLGTDFDDSDRLQINDSIRTIIDRYVLSDTIFDYNFSNLKYLGQITSPDSLIKIITWNLVLKNQPGKYFCYFIRKNELGEERKVFSLTADYTEVPVITDTIYTEKNWYGALYYDLRPFIINSEKYWILLGVDFGNMFITRKIIDVLSFSDDDLLIFGKKCFVSGEEISFREVLEYASNGMISLRFGPDGSIVFDHLVPFDPALKGDRQYYGPDYSYDAYILENDLWKLTINVDARNRE